MGLCTTRYYLVKYKKTLDTCHVALSGEWSPLISKVIEIVHNRSYHNWTEDSHVYVESDSLVWKKLIIIYYHDFFEIPWLISQPDLALLIMRWAGAYEGGGALWIIHQLAFPFLRQSTFYIALHCIPPN